MGPGDDDALAWDGDDDPTLTPSGDVPANRTQPAALPDGWAAVGRDSEQVGRREDDGTVVSKDGTVTAPDGVVLSTPATRMGNAELIVVGVLGGIFLLYAIGWLVGGLRLQGAAQFLVSSVGYTASLVMAVATPLIWFGTVFLMTRGSAAWLRFVWMAVGVIVLIPWPFVMVGAVGQ